MAQITRRGEDSLEILWEDDITGPCTHAAHSHSDFALILDENKEVVGIFIDNASEYLPLEYLRLPSA